MTGFGSSCLLVVTLAAWQGWQVQASTRGNSVDVTGLFQSSVRVSPESLWASMPPIGVDNLDHSSLAMKFINLLQGHRFHRSFMLINNLTSATLDLHSQTKGALVHLKTGVNKTGLAEAEAARHVLAAFAEEMQAVDFYMNTTETKLEEYLKSLPSEDADWVRSIASPVVQHMKQVIAPIQGKTEFMQSVSDTHSICLMATAVLDDLQSVDKIITEYAIPTFNKTASLIPTLQLSVSKGRMNMLRRFADQGYSILDKLRSVAQLPRSTLSPLLTDHLQCEHSSGQGEGEAAATVAPKQPEVREPEQEHGALQQQEQAKEAPKQAEETLPQEPAKDAPQQEPMEESTKEEHVKEVPAPVPVPVTATAEQPEPEQRPEPASIAAAVQPDVPQEAATSPAHTQQTQKQPEQELAATPSTQPKQKKRPHKQPEQETQSTLEADAPTQEAKAKPQQEQEQQIAAPPQESAASALTLPTCTLLALVVAWM